MILAASNSGNDSQEQCPEILISTKYALLLTTKATKFVKALLFLF